MPSTILTINSTIGSLSDLPNKDYIVLTNLQIIPPHASLIIQKSWYSLNFKECKVAVPFSVFERSLIKTHSPALFLQLKLNIQPSIATAIFNKYNNVDFERQITCISPIKEIFIQHQLPISPNALLFEMIEELLTTQNIQNIIAYQYKADMYEMQHYSLHQLLSLKV